MQFEGTATQVSFAGEQGVAFFSFSTVSKVLVAVQEYAKHSDKFELAWRSLHSSQQCQVKYHSRQPPHITKATEVFCGKRCIATKGTGIFTSVLAGATWTAAQQDDYCKATMFYATEYFMVLSAQETKVQKLSAPSATSAVQHILLPCRADTFRHGGLVYPFHGKPRAVYKLNTYVNVFEEFDVANNLLYPLLDSIMTVISIGRTQY